MTQDAQRDMEQRALRNVRTLVDTIETQESENRRALVRLAVWVAIGFAVGAAALYGWSSLRKAAPQKDRVLVIPAPERGSVPPKAP